MTITDPTPTAEAAPEASSTYELLTDRLREVARATAAAASAVNAERAEVFASVAMALVETERVRTESASVPRDLVSVGDMLLLGANVPPGLATNRSVSDTLTLHRLVRRSPTDWEVVGVSADDPANFLNDPSFVRDFGEIYTYYAEASLRSLYVQGDLLLMVFGIGPAASDQRILRWRLNHPIAYIDAYGDHDLVEHQPFDFRWGDVSRDFVVEGRWPHVNIDDIVFFGGSKGTLEVRIDDVVEGGRTILTETLTEPEADIVDARIGYARLGDLLLVRVAPYREPAERFYVFNRLTRAIHRIDAIGRNCHQLPEEQGIVFPGGFHLQNGETKVFATDAQGYDLHATHASPNGEDLLYVFHRPASGEYLLLGYNMVARTMATPVACLGYALFDDGTIVVARHASSPERVHTVSIYDSPFCTIDNYQPAVPNDSFHGRIGNGELVKVLGEALSLARDAESAEFNAAVFEALVGRATRLADNHAWLAESEARGLGDLLVQVRRSAGAVLDEFATVAASKKEALDRFRDAERRVSDHISSVELGQRDVTAFIDQLAAGRRLLGELGQLASVRYVDGAAVRELDARLQAAHGALAGRTLDFLADPSSLDGLAGELGTAETASLQATTAAQVDEQLAVVDAVGDKATLLGEVVGGLPVDDPTALTGVVGHLSDILARRNAVRAGMEARRGALRRGESAAAFAAAMGLLSQRATASQMAATDAAACDSALTGLLAELENVELQHGEVPEFATAIADRRDELAAAFSARRDELAAVRTARVERLEASARRVVGTVATRAAGLASLEEVDGFFAADPLVASVRRSLAQLVEAGEAGRAGELEVSLVAARDAARRAVTDRADLFDDGEVRLGRWHFGVNEEPFELRLVGDGAGWTVKLAGTDLAVDPQAHASGASLDGFADLVGQPSLGETAELPRAVLLTLEAHRLGEGAEGLRDLAATRLDEGYELGVHDTDAALLLAALAPGLDAGLQTSGAARAVAGVWVHELAPRLRDDVRREVAALKALPRGRSRDRFIAVHAPAWESLVVEAGLDVHPVEVADALVSTAMEVPVSETGSQAAARFGEWAAAAGLDLRGTGFASLVRWVADSGASSLDVAAEAAWVLLGASPRLLAGVADTVTVEGLRSTHPAIVEGRLTVDVGRAAALAERYRRVDAPRHRAFAAARRTVLAEWRRELGVETLRPRVLSSFVRNRLVDEVYLPLVGENLARQLGLTGAAQGLLLLVSPPGYGKTSLVEYVADLLGMALVKVSGPALGTGTTSLDPGAAPDAAAAQELVRLNRALAMGTNTILCLDDIQHASPELLQKFIGLCDATRRVEGVHEGRAVTYDLSGKRFAVVMCGNPYTASGVSFRIPDMLANRADVHNLGDVVAGAADAFAQSYVENACSTNDVLAPVLGRSRSDLAVLLRAAAGEDIRADQLSYAYGPTELRQVVDTLRHAGRVRDELMRVNAQYIASASVDDAMRGEPPFLLQGSYRNMARVAQRLVPAMTPAEVDALVLSHYRAESQTLAGAAAWNLAKLLVVLGRATDVERVEVDALRERWRESNVGQDPMQGRLASGARWAPVGLRVVDRVGEGLWVCVGR